MAEGRAGSSVESASAFYARRGTRAADWWTLLHPPYTVWHLSYVAIGAGLAPEINWAMLGASLAAFFLAVGVAAHALDELHGRPLRTTISNAALYGVATVCLVAAILIGIVGLRYAGFALVPCIALGVLLVLGYNLEWFGGRLHTDLGFALAWGAFPVAVGFIAQAPAHRLAPFAAVTAAALAATGLSYAQRRLSTPARVIRRQTTTVTAIATMQDGTSRTLDQAALLAPLEAALKTLSATMPLLAAAVLFTHLR